MPDRYSFARNPRTGEWHVISYVGRNKAGRQCWVPVSDGFKTKRAASAYVPHLRKAIAAQAAELETI